MRSCMCDGGALFVFTLGVGLLCGVCGPRFVEGCFGLGFLAGLLGW